MNNNTQLFSLFATLSKEEQRELAKWVNSPFHNQRADVVAVFQYLRKYSEQAQKLKPETIWAAIAPNEPYDNKSLRYTYSFLLQQIEDFLAYRQWWQDEASRNLSLVRALRQHRAQKQFNKVFDQAKLSLEQQSYRDADYHYHAYHLQYEKYEYEISQDRNTALQFGQFSGQLTLYFVISLLKQRCAIFSHKAMAVMEAQDDIPDHLLEALAEQFLDRSPVVFLYYSMYNLLKNYSDKVYAAIKATLPQQLQQFPPNEQRDLILLTINSCIRQWNSGLRHFLQEALDWYQVGIESKALFENGVLSRFTFKNMVVAAISLEEFQLAEQFVLQYQTFLEEKYRENMVNYCLALLYFRQSDYPRAMQLLQIADYDDVLHNLDARRMLLRIYYDLQETDALLSHMDSFKIYIVRQQNLGYHRTNFLNLIHFTRKIIHANGEKIKLAKIKEEIMLNNHVAEKNWLLGC